MNENIAIYLHKNAYLFIGVIVVALVYWVTFDHEWIASDEGYYAHSAQRVLNGEIPHKDFHEIHPGYITWMNAFSMKVFGESFLSLRIPIVMLGLIQAILLFQIFKHKQGVIAVMSMLLITVMGLPATPNPTANLYALFFSVVAIRILIINEFHCQKWSVLLLGITIGCCILFRQLSGVLLGIGVFVWVLSHGRMRIDLRDNEQVSKISKLILFIAVVLLISYAVFKGDGFSKLLFSYPAIGVAIYAVYIARPEKNKAIFFFKWVFLGMILSFLPIAIYLVWHGILFNWYYDVFVLPMSLLGMEFLNHQSYSVLFLSLLESFRSINSVVQLVHFLSWMGLFLIPPIIGLAALKRLREIEVDNFETKDMHPLIIVGPVYAISAMHYEIALYLLWAIPPVLLASIVSLKNNSALKNIVIGWLFIVIFGVFSSTFRNPVWSGFPASYVLDKPKLLERSYFLGDKARLFLSKEDVDFYKRNLDFIAEHVKSNETIFSFPTHAEWYFLSGRKNPTKHLSPGVSVNSYNEVSRLKELFLKKPPQIVIFKPKDKYNTRYTFDLREWLNDKYTVLHIENGFEFLHFNEYK